MASSQDLPQIDLTGTITERQFNQLKCINRLCKHGDELRKAIELTCSYYNVDYKIGKEVIKLFISYFEYKLFLLFNLFRFVLIVLISVYHIIKTLKKNGISVNVS